MKITQNLIYFFILAPFFDEGRAFPYGRVYPVFQTVKEKSAAFIHCTSFNKPRWLKNWHHMVNFYKKLQILAVAQEDTGRYTCQGSFPNDTTFSATSVLRVARELDSTNECLLILILF